MYFATMYVDFYFNTNMDSTYAQKYYTLVCFHLGTTTISNDDTLLIFEDSK